MSTFNQGILGPFSGKVGTVIGASWKGISYMRGIAATVSNPRTPAQLAQRAKFAAAIKFLQPLTPFLRVGYKSQAIQMSAFNAAMSYTVKNALTGTYPDYEIDYPKAMVSQGNFPGALNPATTSATANEVEFTWENNSWETDASPDDQAVLVVYNPIKQAAVSVVGGITRAVGAMAVTLPNSFAGDEVQCYIAFINANQSVISNSQYVSGLIV